MEEPRNGGTLGLKKSSGFQNFYGKKLSFH
jgi:hypothetical protein